MSAALRLVPAQPVALADAIDDVRLLVEVASMAVMDFESDRRRTALRALLDVIDDKLSALSETVLPGGGV